MSSDSKHVQTELTEEEYEHVREFARERGLSLKEATREALTDWVDRQRRADPSDPAFTILEELEHEALPDDAKTDARREGDLVEEWDGSDVDFTLSSNPAAAGSGDRTDG